MNEAVFFNVSGLFTCHLIDCNQSASEQNDESMQQEHGDQEDRGETTNKEEDKCSFMSFPVTEVAEQLTRLDAVGDINKNLEADSCINVLPNHSSSSLPLFHAGAVCQSRAFPLPGLRLVPARQERKPKLGTHRPSHHFPVQRRHQSCHHFTPLPSFAQPFHLLSHLIPRLFHSLPLPVHCPELAPFCTQSSRPPSTHH